MAGSPVSPGEVIALIKKAIDLYKEVKDYTEQIEKIGKRMPRLRDYLEELQELLDTRKNPGGIASLRATQVRRLNDLIGAVKDDAKDVYDLLRRWKENQGPGGVIFRFDWVAHLVYVLGSSPDKLQALGESIEAHLIDINRFVVLLSAFAHNAAMQQKAAQSKAPGKKKEKKVGKSPSPAPLTVPAIPAARSPSPSPVVMSNCTITFVDGDNVGRSRIAEGYMKLLGESTLRKKLTWRIASINSHGWAVSNTAGPQKELAQLNLALKPGAETPNFVAMDSLFDNKLLDFPFKHQVRTSISQRKARGLPKDLFTTNDFIIVFTLAQQINLIRLRELLVNFRSSSSDKKGRIVLLGDYVKRGSQIYEAKPFTDRTKWNKVTGKIKPAVKAFLKKEMDWTPPT
ncbi:hypothetical protein BT63DRAFT_186926 [Microthyrium microscopicum]|uniref:Uncharacterized protein n=1 Tax=Microthyrium microscopicum TaxID=703497 RepID=A0A6A6UKK7_9PEZI|nr:hypothetical protein BT63DRAFT_186926 [Microthyrium microscopicum]